MEDFVNLKNSLVTTSDTPLAESLGVTVEELTRVLLLGAQNEAEVAEKNNELATLMSISLEDLNLLFGFNIDRSGVAIDGAAKVGSSESLDLLYRPVRLARSIGLNVAELQVVLRFMGVLPGNDPNTVTYEQIHQAYKMARIARLLGLQLVEIPPLLAISGNIQELLIQLAVLRWNEATNDWENYANNEWWISYSNANGDERVEKLAQELDTTPDQVLALVEGVGGQQGSSWLEPTTTLTLRVRTDIVRRWVGIAQQLGINVNVLYKTLADSFPNFSIDSINTFYKLCALAVDAANLHDVITTVDWIGDLDGFNTVADVERTIQLVVLARYLDLSIPELARLNRWEHQITKSDVEHLCAILETAYPDKDQLEKELEKPKARILEKTRDALLDYATSLFLWPSRDRLTKGMLLIDLQSAACTTTNLILQAIESLQTYVLQVRTGIEKTTVNNEPVELKSQEVAEKWAAMERDWRWMRRYVLWEAAQKVFLYPENYVMPELRDNKTAFYQEFEDELSQGEVTQALAEQALSAYVDKLHDISALRTSGTVYDPNEKTLHILARSQVNERATYYRTLKDRRIWSSWLKLPVEINSDRIYPLVAYDRVYLFWLETEEETEDDQTVYNHKLSFSYAVADGKWSKAQSQELSEVLSTAREPWVNLDQRDDDIQIVIVHPRYTVASIDYEYYEAGDQVTWNELPNFDELAPNAIGRASDFDLEEIPNRRDDNFAVRFNGYLFARRDGEYAFFTTSDDGSQLFINDTLIVDNDGLHPMQERSGTVELKRGRHPITVTYFERMGAAGLSVQLLSPGFRNRYEIGGNWLSRKEAFRITCNNVLDYVSASGVDSDINLGAVIYDSDEIDSAFQFWLLGLLVSGYTAFSPDNVPLPFHSGVQFGYQDDEVVDNRVLFFELRSHGSSSRGVMRYFEIRKLGAALVFERTELLSWQCGIVRNADGSFELMIIDNGILKYLSIGQWGHLFKEITVLGNIDADSFRVDDAVRVENDVYFFCSDRDRCLMIVAHSTTDALGVEEVKFSICQLNHGKYCSLADRLFREGIDAFYDPALSSYDLEADFSEYSPNPDIDILPSSRLEFCGPNKAYNQELFFHIPYLVADNLTQNRKFELAERWYHYIFNPYSDPDPSDPEIDVTWNYLPFNDEEIQQLEIYINDVEDTEIWRNDPFNPHAIARVRPGAYQKAVLLAYIENLLEWADRDFTQDTRETINQARNRYLVAEQLLKLPELRQDSEKAHDEQTLAEIMLAISEALSTALEEAEDQVDNLSDGSSSGSCCIYPDFPDLTQVDDDVYNLGEMLARLQVGCIPENPIFESYRRHIHSNLRKIRSCRNIAGLQRILPLYDASVDPMAIVRAVSSGAGLGDLNLFSSAAGISPYRFAYLIERAKALASQVVQAGNALLLAIEKQESEELAYLRAQQELKLSKANVHLRKLQVAEAEDSLKLAELQTLRAVFQRDHFEELIRNNLNDFELNAVFYLFTSINALSVAQSLQQHAAIASLIPNTTTGGPSAGATYGGSNIAGMLSARAASYSTQSSIESIRAQISNMFASFERRLKEWEFQKGLAGKDIAISEQNEEIAKDRIAIAEFEQQIAEMNAEFADQTLEFLKEKFTNKELYRWMVKTLSKILYGFYNLAYTTARMAQATMEFERNEAYDFISYGYWDSEKRGLLSGDQLLLDINRMDDAYVQNNARKLEITKHISLARMAPEALAELRSNGRTTFATDMRWFDRDFPGHYQRTLKSVRTSVLALVGPGMNVNATLSTVSPSYIVLHPEEDEPVALPRIQSVALSGASNATGLFELNYRDERYLPFEGCGVAVTWELEMPKASNQFDFDSIVDVILTIDYTALSDGDYKLRVIEELGDGVGGMLPLSIRNTFADAWYHFHNPTFRPPEQAGGAPEPYALVLNVTREMFPPNEESHALESAALRFSLTDPQIRLPLKIRYESEQGEVVELNRQTGSDGYLPLQSGFGNKSPFGTWEIALNRDQIPQSLWALNEDGSPQRERITDPNRDQYILDTGLIEDVMLALTYEAKLPWPSDT